MQHRVLSVRIIYFQSFETMKTHDRKKLHTKMHNYLQINRLSDNMLKLLIYFFLRHAFTQWNNLTAVKKTLNLGVYTSCYNITEYVNNIKTLQ